MAPKVHALPPGPSYHGAVLDFLWDERERLPSTLVLVPTAQSARRLRLGLAQRGGVLAPSFGTPSLLMRPESYAPDAIEELAWVQVLEAVTDWSAYQVLFPEPPRGRNWALGLARGLHATRLALQENGHLFATAARAMEGTVEEERWAALALLERGVEKSLSEWGLSGRNSLLADGHLVLPEGIERVVVAGIFDLPPVVSRFLEKTEVEVAILIPDHDLAGLDQWGRPEAAWLTCELPWPSGSEGSVTLTGDPAQQAAVVREKVALNTAPSSEVAIGTGDEEVSPELVKLFRREGWVLHDPAGTSPSPVRTWLQAWRGFLQNGEVAEAIDLLSLEQTGALTRGTRARRARDLSRLRDLAMVRTLEDIDRFITGLENDLSETLTDTARARLEKTLQFAHHAKETMTVLRESRSRFLRTSFHRAMNGLLGIVDPDDRSGLSDWLEETRPVAEQLDPPRPVSFWLDLALAHLQPFPVPILDGRVLDVQGWLELVHEPAPHLVLCGFHDGSIPGRVSADPWLPEATRERLGLSCDRSRAARDAFLLYHLMNGRRLDLIVGKLSQGGDVLKPSRLLLKAKGEELARRVKVLFAEVPPADAGVAFTLDERWRWQPREVDPPDRLSVTAIAKYLDCPLRYYLERVIHMNRPEPDRVEWNHRDFGNVMHEVLEAWGRDEAARELTEALVLTDWLHQALDAVVARRLGESLSLAIELQREAMRQRLGWFAQVQVQERLAGWRVVEVEWDFSLKMDGVTITGQIDRIDQNEKGQLRVLDYKTSAKAKEVVSEHLRKPPRDMPPHLEGVDAVFSSDGLLWKNVQVPLYAAAREGIIEVGYFALGETEQAVQVNTWPDFGKGEQDSALRCTAWVIAQIKAQKFTPPNPKPAYDSFAELAYGRGLEQAMG